MITKHLIVLQAVVLLGLGSIFLLPKGSGHSPAGILMELPAEVGLWTSESAKITDKELAILSKDTQFVRRLYHSPFGDNIFVGIVLSGEDMVNSIHRPERCMPAQGWFVERSHPVGLPLNQAGRQFGATQLESVQQVQVAPDKSVPLHNLTYYWFVGSRNSTPSHLERTYLDIKDRILHGENQRWAYITVASNVTDNVQRFGRTEAQTAKLLEQFIKDLVPKLQRPDGSPIGGS